jgi:hypothetical protein
MANKLSKTGIVSLATIKPWHVSQSIDAFTGLNDYDITLSGSLVVTGSVAINGLTNTIQNSVLTYDANTGLLYYTASSTFAVNNYYTSSITQSITSSTVNNNINNSTINQTIISSSVNNVAPSNQYIQYNSASAFGASADFQFVYSLSSLQQGNTTLAQGQYSHAEGKATYALGISSHAEGDSSTSKGDWSHAEGRLTTASGSYSHAEGNFNIASGYASHTEGAFTQATEQYSHAEGLSTIASSVASHAEGHFTTASGGYSHAEGGNTSTIGIYSHAEGRFTTTRGIGSHTEGQQTFTIGQYSHAEGRLTTASANYSHAEGYSTVTNADYQHVQGQFNQLSPVQSAFIIGNGVSDTSRSNLVFAADSSFQVTGSLNVSGSFSAQYRNLGSVAVPAIGSGISVTSKDYNVVFTATITAVGEVNKISLPSNVPPGTVIYLQRISGTSACQVSGSSGQTINGAAGFSFPTTVYTRRMFVHNGTGWFVEV